MTRPAAQSSGQEATRAGSHPPYASAVAAQLARAPRQLAPEDAAAIGDLIGPLASQQQEAGAA